jgi:uncharacterized protein
MTINPIDILKTHYADNYRTYQLLVRHSEKVAQKALSIAQKLTDLKPDLEFIAQAAMLHDIGIGLTNTPALGCTGLHPYVCHGVLGRRLLEQYGLFRHALVCERHIGVGLYAEEIERLNFPMPVREMLPLSIEEKIICYSDKFFSKENDANVKEKSISKIIGGLRRYGMDKVLRFYALHNDLNSVHP